MIARKVKPEEVKRTEELFSISFDSSYDNQQSPAELYSNYINSPKSREQEHCLERFAAFEDNDTTMMSSFIMQPFDVKFDGHDEPMLSIGGVATLPQYRKRGGIRACFQTVLPYMYEKGTVFSYLYPFSTAYYRKFGYELCCKKNLWQIGLSHIPTYAISGSCYLLDSSTAELAAKDLPLIYDKWQSEYNMMVKQIEYDYQFTGSANPYKDQIFTYVYRSAANEPLAYMTFTCNTHPEQRRLECSRFFYSNAEGFKGLLSLAKSFASDYRHITFALPSDRLLEPVLPEWSMGAVDCKQFQNGMVRVINAAKVLSDAQYIGDGSLSIEITDPYIPENNGVFLTNFKNGQCTDVSLTRCQPDISFSISAFSAFIAGGYDTSSLSLFEDIKIHGNQEMLAKVFYRKSVYISTSF